MPLSRSPITPRCFDARQQEAFEGKVRRGLYVRMSDEEVEAARRKFLNPAHETEGAP